MPVQKQTHQGILQGQRQQVSHKEVKWSRSGERTIVQVDEHQSLHFFALCYSKCRVDQNDVGSMYWKKCSGIFAVDGGVICCLTKEDNRIKNRDVLVNTPMVIDHRSLVEEMKGMKDIVADAL